MWSIFKQPKLKQSGRGSTLYEYRLGRRFDPGASGDTFLPVLNNPVVIVTRGSGRLAGALRPLQPAQVWFGPQVGRQGLGGIQAGQIVGQRLIDPSQLDNEGGQ